MGSASILPGKVRGRDISCLGAHPIETLCPWFLNMISHCQSRKKWKMRETSWDSCKFINKACNQVGLISILCCVRGVVCLGAYNMQPAQENVHVHDQLSERLQPHPYACTVKSQIRMVEKPGLFQALAHSWNDSLLNHSETHAKWIKSCWDKRVFSQVYIYNLNDLVARGPHVSQASSGTPCVGRSKDASQLRRLSLPKGELVTTKTEWNMERKWKYWKSYKFVSTVYDFLMFFCHDK